MLDNEKEIIEEIKNGKKEAFGLLYDHYQPRIYRFIYLKVSQKEDAEDLTHQVFLSALRKINEYEERGLPFSGWLYRIARNEVIDFYRKRKLKVSLEEVNNTDSNLINLDQELNDKIDLKIQIENVKKAILKLKADYQDIIIMRFVDDLSIKEIAQVLQKSEGAVKLMQHRAIKALRQILNNN